MENLLHLAEYLGLRPSFKRAFLQHPGIFYVSSKIGMHTVVNSKRGMLIEWHPLMGIRWKYIQLMNVVKWKNDDEVGNVGMQEMMKAEFPKGGIVRRRARDIEEIVLESSTRSSRRRNALGGKKHKSWDDDETDD
ncbi:hypothetical protein SASPL_100889 [Salvia splendens]|uniref:PORR domain-containing protein n=1 Tax=Salvia splendens TaxID=180675 RepID=A0A8X8YUT2_SALSN|nr:hypothetical protein SASPL_100889 [Salvia splendens]